MAKSTIDQLDLFSLLTSTGSSNVISSPDLVDGLMPPVSLGGPTTARFGPAPPHASRSQSRAREPAFTISGICGQTSFVSSESVAPPQSWVSRLQERLATIGSTESALIWKAKAIGPNMRTYRLAPSTRRTDETASIGSRWPTPQATDSTSNAEQVESKQARGSGGINLLPAAQTHWPTPQVDSFRSRSGNCKHEMGLDQLARHQASPRATPCQRDYRHPNAKPFSERGGGAKGEQLVNQVAHWVSPTAEDGRRG